jgi:hypothetical protein
MRRAYRYPLQALQNLRGTEVDAARAALHMVEKKLVTNQSDSQTCSASMRQLEHEVRGARSSGQFDIDQQRASYFYLSHLRRRLATLQLARAELLQQEQQSLNQLIAARSVLRTMEKHHARLGDAHLLETVRAAQREADDSWLARARAHESAS